MFSSLGVLRLPQCASLVDVMQSYRHALAAVNDTFSDCGQEAGYPRPQGGIMTSRSSLMSKRSRMRASFPVLM